MIAPDPQLHPTVPFACAHEHPARTTVRTRAERYPNWRRPANTDYRVFQHQCYAFVGAAVRAGVLPNLKIESVACVDCGRRATQWEHRNYALPLDVEPICKGCNLKRGTGKFPKASDFSFKRL